MPHLPLVCLIGMSYAYMACLLLHFHSVTYVWNSLFTCLGGTLGGLYHFLNVSMTSFYDFVKDKEAKIID